MGRAVGEGGCGILGTPFYLVPMLPPVSGSPAPSWTLLFHFTGGK